MDFAITGRPLPQRDPFEFSVIVLNCMGVL
jgi:hypothetical protein